MRQKIKIFLFIFLSVSIIFISFFSMEIHASSSDKIVGYNQKTQYGYYTRTYRITQGGLIEQTYSSSSYFTFPNPKYNAGTTGSFYLYEGSYINYNLQSTSNRYTGNTNNWGDTGNDDNLEAFEEVLGCNIKDNSDGAYSSRPATKYIYSKETFGEDLSKWQQYFIGNGWYYNCTRFDDGVGFFANQRDYDWEGIYLSGTSTTMYKNRYYSYSISDSSITWFDERQSHDNSPVTISDGTKTVIKRYMEYGTRLTDDTNNPIYDLAAPTISGVEEGESYNTNKTVQVSDNNQLSLWEYSKGATYYSGFYNEISGTSKQFTDDGWYKIKAYDSVENESSVSFIIDKTKPVISGIENDGYYNSDKTITFYDATSGIANVKINDVDVSLSNDKYTISDDGIYTIVAIDKAGNEATMSITIDKTVPLIVLSGNDDSSSNYYKSVSVICSDTNVSDIKYSKDSSEYKSFTSGTSFSMEGSYIVSVSDKAGNETIQKFTIDKTAPTISGVVEGESYNTNKRIDFSDNYSLDLTRFYINNKLVALNTSSYTIKSSDYQGDVTIKIYDKAGNYSEISFKIDITSPELTVSNANLSSGIYYINDCVVIKANESVTFSYNNLTSSGTSITLYASDFSNGKYILTATDKAGNTTSVNLYFDSSSPTINLTNVSEYNGIYYSKNSSNLSVSSGYSPIASISLINSLGTSTLDINKTINTLSQPGTNKIVVTNLAGNSSEATLIIDTVSPIINIKANGSSLANNAYTNSNITISYSDEVLLAIIPGYVTYNGETIECDNNQVFTEEGAYLFTVYDCSGNKTEKKVIIDKTNPIISGVIPGSYYNQDKKITFSDASSGILKVLINNEQVELNNNAYTIKTSDYYGEVAITTYDLAGNILYTTIYMDNLAPTVNFDNNKYYSYNISAIVDDLSISADSYLKLNGEIIFNFSNSNKKYNTSSDGKYELYLKDTAGNEKTYTFYVDTVAPEAVITGYTSTSSHVYKANSSSIINVSWEDDASITFNNVTYNNNFNINVSDLSDGEYEIVIKDLAGNYTTYILDIKSSIPEATFEGYFQKLNDIYYLNASTVLEVSWTDTQATAVLNGSDEYRNKFNIDPNQYDEGIYNLLLIDAYNNSSEYTIVIDKTKDDKNYNNLLSQNFSWINHWYNTYSYSYNNQNYSISDYYSFKTYEEAEDYARIREVNTYEKIIYTGQTIFASDKYGNVSEYYDYENLSTISIGDDVYIYKSPTNASKILVYFSYSNFKRAMDSYIAGSISDYYRYFNNDSNIKEAYNNNLYYDTFYIKESEYTLSKAESTTIIYTSKNGSSWQRQTNKATITSGTNYIKEVDIAGNETFYTVVLNKTALNYSVFGNTQYTKELNNTNTLYASMPIVLQVNGEYPEHNIIRVSYKALDNSTISYYVIDDGLNLTEEGTYTIDTYDICGNKSSTYTIYILYSSVNLPKITYEINKLDGIVIDLNFTIDYYQIVNNQIKNILVKYTNEEGVSSYITVDGNSNNITTSSKSLIFVESGTYEISLTDIFGNEATAQETLQKGNPFGQIMAGNPGYAVPSGTVTNQNIYFVYNSEYEYKCLLNGSSYVSGTGITKEGYYEFVLSNADKTATYIVTIDKTAPQGSIIVDGQDFPNNKTTSSKNVKFTFNEDDAKATLNGVNIRSGEFITEEKTNIILLSDEAGNVSEYKITLDYTAPTVKIYSGSYEVESGSIVNSKIKFEWTELNCKAYVNGSLYTSGKWYSLANTYTLMIEDQYGNSKEYYVTIDLSNPEFTIYDSDNNILNNNSKINKGFYVTWEDDSYMVYVNSNPYTKNTILSQAKDYIIQVVNVAGTIIENNISISYNLPSGTLFNYNNQILQTGSTINTKFYFSYTDTKQNRFTCYVNDALYQNSQIIKQDGSYEFKLVDAYGNIAIYNINKDSVAPEGELVGVINGGLTNSNVYFIFDEADANALLDGILYFSNTEIIDEGFHSIDVYDSVGNINTYTFTIDKTAPLFIYSKEPNENGYINQKISISWTESNCTATLNDKPYILGNRIYDGEYVFKLMDKAGNIASASFIVDTSSPVININGIDRYGNANQNVDINWSGEYSVYLNDLLIPNNYTVEEDGKYKIIAYNLSGNSSEYEFEISREEPTGTLIDIQDGGITNSPVKFIFEGGTATLNGTSYSSGTIISREGIYKIVLTNKFNNQKEYTFTIDKTVPVINLHGVNPGKSTKDDVYATFEEDNLITKLNNNIYNPSDIISEEGLYTLTAQDIAGNIAMVTFTIDKTAPVPTFEGVEPGKATNSNVYISWNENATAYLNGKSYTSGSLISKEGNYEFIIQDSLGNTNIYLFVIDKTAPTYIIYDGNSEALKSNATISSAFYVICEEENSTILMNDELYMSAIISEDGRYEFEVKDDLGNSTHFYMIIDHTLPEATFEGVVPGGITKSDVIISFSRDIKATLNDKDYISGTKIKLEGSYTLVLVNEINNTNIYTFTIDKTAPEAIFDGLNEYDYSNDRVIVTFNEDDAKATLNGNPYYSGVIINEESSYQLELIDCVGNINTYTFTIDKTAPEGELVGVSNFGYTNKPVSFTWDDITYRCYLNLEEYSLAASIKADGEYELKLVDLAGNANYYHFSISTVLPEATFEGLNEYNYSNDKTIIFFEKATAELDGQPFLSGNIVDFEGEHTLKIIDDYGNANTYTFTIDKTAPYYEINGAVPNGYTNQAVYVTWSESNCTAYLNNEKYYKGSSIKQDGEYEFKLIDIAGNASTCNFSISTVLPEATFEGLNEYNYSNDKVIINFNSSIIATLNNSKYTALTEIVDEGQYTLVLSDKYNNIKTYEFEIDKTAPEFTVAGMNNITYTNKNVRFTWEERNCKAYLNEEEYLNGTIIREDGIYSFKLEDIAGNITEFTFERLNVIPEVTLNASFYKKNNTCKDVTCIWEDDSYIVMLNNETYLKESLISGEGTYILSVTDKYGNYHEYDFTIDKTAPDCSITGVENNGYTNKKTKIVSQEYNIDIVVNGEVLTRDYITTQNNENYNGKYNVKVYDSAGNYTEFNFEYLYKELKEDLKITKNEDETKIVLNCEQGYTMAVDNKIVSSGYELNEAGSYKVVISDQYGNSYEQKLTVKAINTPNYIFTNIATIASISLISLLIIFIFVKKIRANSKNPYKRK